MLLDCGQRFANAGSEFASDLAERIEHVLLLCRLCLLLIQNIFRIAVFCTQAQYILASELCNGAFENRGAGCSLADLLGDFRSQPCIFRLSHQSQGPLHLLVRNQVEEGRLLKFYGQSLSQRVVKYRIAGLILEICEDESVLLGESWGTVNIKIHRGGQPQNGRSGSKHALPAASSGGDACQFPLQHGSGLPAAAGIFLQTPAHDFFEPS